MEGIPDIVPGFGRDAVLEEIGGEGVEAEVALLLRFPVTLETVLGENGVNVLLEIDRAKEGGGRKEQEEKQGLERGGDGTITTAF